MKNKELAKHLLLDETCDTCNHRGKNFMECGLLKNIPSENTCNFWEKRIIPDLDIRMQAYPITAKARKLNIRYAKND